MLRSKCSNLNVSNFEKVDPVRKTCRGNTGESAVPPASSAGTTGKECTVISIVVEARPLVPPSLM